jgi:hypothetical protein
LASKVLLIGNVSDIDIISDEILQDEHTKIFSFDLDVHEKLVSKKITHNMADNLLNQEQRMNIFDKLIEFRSWHSNLPSNKIKYENVNLLKLFDSNEFLQSISSKIINSIIIHKIIETEKPSKVFVTTFFSSTIKSIPNNKNFTIHIFDNPFNEELMWDSIPIKFNFGKLNFNFNISKKKYLKLKNIIENSFKLFYNFNFNLNSKNKKNIIFLEFNVQSFSNLFLELKKSDQNVILVNQRRPAIWSKNSFNVVKNSNYKILQLEEILSKEEKVEILKFYHLIIPEINKLWENSIFFNNLFKIDDVVFWDIIKDNLIKSYSEKMYYYVELIASIKKFFDNVDASCIISLNEIGETEKAFLEFNKNKIPSILLEHGFLDKNDSVSKVKRYDIMSNYSNFTDKIAVWSETKKSYLIDNYQIDPNRIIVSGSPRHDNYFSSRKNNNNKKEKILLLAPNPINDMDALSTTELKLRFNELIKKIILNIKTLDNVKLIVKLHATSLKHNEEIKLLINKIDKNIPVYLSNSVIDVINSSDAVMVISPESGTTTMILESMILGKPTMNIYFENTVPQFNHVKHHAVLSLLDTCDLKDNISKILFDYKFKNELISNADIYLSKYLDYNGNSSKRFAEILKSY